MALISQQQSHLVQAVQLGSHSIARRHIDHTVVDEVGHGCTNTRHHRHAFALGPNCYQEFISKLVSGTP